MPPSPHALVLDDVPSSPSSAWSWTGSCSPGSAAQDHFPPTPDSCLSSPPTVVTSDDFTLQLDLQLDEVARGSPRKSNTNRPLPRPSPLPLRTDPYLPRDDTSKTQVLLRNARRRDNLYGRFESSPPRPRTAPRVPPVSLDDASDDFLWEAAHSALDSGDLVDPSHCSLLIREVSLLVGLTANEDRIFPGDDYPLICNAPAPDILPLTLTPTKSLAPRKHRNITPTLPVKTSARVHSANTVFPSSIDLHVDNASPSPHIEKPSSARATDLATPIARHQNAVAARPSLSQHRRQGQIFHCEPPPSSAPHRHPVDLGETFSYPRKPPQKPTLNRTTNRYSSLDRLEQSLQKLEAYAPGNHRKSQSDGQSSEYAVQKKDNRCPSLPPPRRLKKQQSSHENVRRIPSRPIHGGQLSASTPTLRPALPRQYVAPQVSPPGTLDGEHDTTPGSFMDMDIPAAQEASQKRQTPFANKKKTSLVSVARRLSRGVIAWGKNLAGSARPSFTAQEMTTVQGAGRL